MRRSWRDITAALVAAACLGSIVSAQGNPGLPPSTLIADNIRFDQGSTTVVASGAVEIFFDGARLRATSITYDGAADRVQVEGPLTLVDASGRTVIFADFADLSADLQDGVLQSARLVLDRQLQIAATQIDRTDGRYTQLYQAVASACEVCFGNPTPLWEIRARRVVHDQAEQQLYFENAQFRIAGLPVFYLPRMRLPDPTLERATGFLAPSISSDDTLGTQLVVPYFIRLGDSADLTVTPWIGLGDSRTLELRYRRAFRNGEIEVEGAVSWDDLTEDATRGFVFSTGRFELPRDYLLNFQLQGVTDRGYLTTYSFPDPDLLETFVELSRVRRDEYIEASATIYNSLREGDDNTILPTHVAHAEITRRFTPPVLGGTATAYLEGSAFYRQSDLDGPDGRDVGRLSGQIQWSDDLIIPGGIRTTFEAALHGGIYNVAQGAELSGTVSQVTPYAAVELRWPFQSSNTRGVSHLLEPVAQFVWSDTYGGTVPFEDSSIVEFDEANLFALDRFPGSDQRETGARANLGLGYTRTDPLGWSAGIVAGVVLRAEDEGQFTEGSGLDGTRSDWLVATHLSFNNDLTLINRALFDTTLDFTSNEFALNWSGARHDLVTSYTWLEADPLQGRPVNTAEWLFDGNYALDSGWEAGVNWRYDFAEVEPTQAGLTLGYENECVDMEFSVSRRYTTSTSLEPATTFGFTVSLAGFGAGREGRSTARSCRAN